MSKTKVRIWDLPTRLFHWTLALLVLGSFITVKVGDDWLQYHFYCGYAILVLMLFRLIWGFVGGRYARFSSFLFGPTSVLRYLRNHPQMSRTLGHNPLGSLSVWALLAAVGFQVVSGLFSNDDIAAEGPLVKYISNATSSLLTSLHHANEPIILSLIGLHIAAVIGYLVFKRENLIAPMVVGDKEVDTPSGARTADDAFTPTRDDGPLWRRAVLVLAICVAVVWRLVR